MTIEDFNMRSRIKWSMTLTDAKGEVMDFKGTSDPSADDLISIDVSHVLADLPLQPKRYPYSPEDERRLLTVVLPNPQFKVQASKGPTQTAADADLFKAIEWAKKVWDEHEMVSPSGQSMSWGIFELAERAGILKVCDRCDLDGCIEEAEECPDCEGEGFVWLEPLTQ